ncbi:hydrolase [Clostridium novyi A str. 4552]|uniref:Hydrolase n=1 Tax=Clostridium novyi A str. 4552 TaxID=1444289 RepID=A0A0A0I2X7_CLONO|nr:PHP domain-containing protein [Clostridium novyi]KGM95008.1 hydrolase [Clostridium novyi A str. 4552]
MYKKGDFHLHTTASDGKLSPCELVNLAKKQDFDIIAITDHDNTFGLKEGISTGKKIGIKVLPGIELSTRYNNESIHILGYFKDDSYKSDFFQNYLKEIQDYRIKRAKKILDNLYKFFNIKLDFHKILKSNKGVIARPHIAKAIVNAGYPYDFDFIFDNMIGNDSPAYVPNKEISIEEGIDVLKSANAITSLAHPTLINKTPIEEFLKYNFDCIEAIYPLNKQSETENFIKLAQKYNKTISGGSDYHGLGKTDTKHGYIGDAFLTKIFLKNFLKLLNL